MRWIRRIAWLLTGAYWAGIFTLTHLPPEKIVHAPQFWDKAEHFLAYFLLAALLGTALMFTFPQRRSLPLWVLLVGFTYAVVDELLQPFVHRDAEVLDWVADAIGVWAAVVILWVLQRLLIPRRKSEGFPVMTSPASPAAADIEP
jgi:VanZ family protein